MFAALSLWPAFAELKEIMTLGARGKTFDERVSNEFA